LTSTFSFLSFLTLRTVHQAIPSISKATTTQTKVTTGYPFVSDVR